MTIWLNNLKEELKTIDKNKKYIFLVIFILTTAIVFVIYKNTFYYEFYFNEKLVGIIEEKSIAEKMIHEITLDIESKYGEKAYFKKETRFQEIRVPKEQLIKKDQLVQSLLGYIHVYRPAAVITVDGEDRLAVDTMDKSEKILQMIKMHYIDKIRQKSINEELLLISFKQEVKIILKDVLVDEISFQEENFDEIIVNKELLKFGPNFSFMINRKSISRAYQNKISTSLNPAIGELIPHQKLDKILESSSIDVIAKIRKTEKLQIDYKVQKKNDSSLYSGVKKIMQEGKKGEKEIIKIITYINGISHEEEVIQEKIIKDPITQVVLIGTKKRPQTALRRVAPTYNGDIGYAIVATAKHYIGVPYKQGGASPSGFDCSGFTQFVYRQYDINIPRTSSGQGSAGGYVSRGNLKPGDLVIFKGHSGIYTGGSSFIHSPKPGKSVQISSINSSYWSTNFISGRRVY